MSRAEKEFGFRAKVKFEEGVEEFGLGMPGWEDGQLKGIVFKISQWC